jgi:acetyltransferase-like isoleucine patch superfamily enzyme
LKNNEIQERTLVYREQHKQRLNWMPWLYYSLSEKHKSWAFEWQKEVQDSLAFLETVVVGENCFVSSEAKIFSEPGRGISIQNGSWIGGNAFLHGPIRLGDHCSINHGTKMDGGAAGIVLGSGVRIAPGCALFAFNHGTNSGMEIRNQGVSSKGICIGNNVWIGANCCVADGVTLGNDCIVGMGAVVTKNFPSGVIIGGVPARILKDRN